MFKAVLDFLKNIYQLDKVKQNKETSKDFAKQRLHILLVQDRASVSANFIDTMKAEVIEVIKKYIVFKEEFVEMDITTTVSNDGQKTETGIFLKIPIENIRNEMKSEVMKKELKEKAKILDEKKKSALNTNNILENNILQAETENIAFDVDVTEEELKKIEELKKDIEEAKNIKPKSKAKAKKKKEEEESLQAEKEEEFKQQYDKIFNSTESKQIKEIKETKEEISKD